MLSTLKSWAICATVCASLSIIPINAYAAKVAVLDYVTALLKTDKASSLLKKLKKELKKEESRIRSLEEDIKSLAQKAERDGSVMSDSEKEELSKNINAKGSERATLIKKFQARQKETQDEILEALKPGFEDIVNNVIKSGGYDFVLDRRAVVYFDPKHDITEQVTKELNKSTK